MISLPLKKDIQNSIGCQKAKSKTFNSNSAKRSLIHGVNNQLHTWNNPPNLGKTQT